MRKNRPLQGGFCIQAAFFTRKRRDRIGVAYMNGRIYRRFTKALRTIAPGFPVADKEIRAMLKTQGLGRFIKNAGGAAAGLAEAAELLLRMEKRGACSEPG
jgi:hypothetical protein